MSTEIQTINQNNPPVEVIVSGNGTLDTLERASIDMQIATAHRFPRSVTTFNMRAIAMATYDEDTAASCLYCRPVGRDPSTGQQKYANGMSVRLAEIVAACFGNLRVAARIVEIDPRGRYVVAQGVAHDLETNYLCTSQVIESTVGRNKQPYDERMRMTVAKAALAKARRDAIFQVVPKALAKPIEAAVRKLLAGDSKPLVERRDKVVQWVQSLSIDPKRVWNALGIGGVDDLMDEQLNVLTGLKTSIREGDVTIDEAFPEIERETETEAKQQTVLEKATSKLKERASRSKPDEKALAEHTAKMKEIESWVMGGCSERDDYAIAIQQLQNFVNEGKLKPEWLEDAKKVVAAIAKKNGINL